MSRPVATAAALAAALVAVCVAACGPPPPASAEAPPNIVLVVLCSFRSDHLGAAGYPRSLTPFLDRLAAEGAFFDNTVSASSWTKPSTASLLTGLTPNVHQMHDFYPLDAIRQQRITPRVLPAGFETLPESLAAAGYATFCRVNNLHAGAFFGLTQGCQNQVTRHGMGTAEMVADLAAWLAPRDRRRPFFALLFTRDVHTPYNPPYEEFVRLNGEPAADGPPSAGVGPPPADPSGFAGWRREVDAEVRRRTAAGGPVPEGLRRAWVDLYDAQLPALDAALSRLPEALAAAGAAERTLIAVTADHGDRLFEHGLIGHGGLLDEAVLRIPLILRGPGVPSGLRVEPVVRSIDLYPTLAELAGAAAPALLQGASLLPLLRGEAATERTAFSSFNAVAHTLRRGRWKLYHGPGERRALYDLATDPAESRDRLAAEPATARRLAADLRHWLEGEAALARVVEQAGTRDLPPELIEELRALGYL